MPAPASYKNNVLSRIFDSLMTPVAKRKLLNDKPSALILIPQQPTNQSATYGAFGTTSFFPRAATIFDIVDSDFFYEWLAEDMSRIKASKLTSQHIDMKRFAPWLIKNYALLNWKQCTKCDRALMALFYPATMKKIFPDANTAYSSAGKSELIVKCHGTFADLIDINLLNRSHIEYIIKKHACYVQDKLTDYSKLNARAWRMMYEFNPHYVSNFKFKYIRCKTELRQLLFEVPELITYIDLSDLQTCVLTGKEWKTLLEKNKKILKYASNEVKEALKEYRLVCKLMGRD